MMAEEAVTGEVAMRYMLRMPCTEGGVVGCLER